MTKEQKLAEMELLSQQASAQVSEILYDTHAPFEPVKLLRVNRKDVSWTKDALSLSIYFSLHYGYNLKKLSGLVAAKNPIAGLILSGIGRVLEGLGKHYHLKQEKIF